MFGDMLSSHLFEAYLYSRHAAHILVEPSPNFSSLSALRTAYVTCHVVPYSLPHSLRRQGASNLPYVPVYSRYALSHPMLRYPQLQLPLRPALPWEVIENVIEQSYDQFQVLYNFSFTCHQLRPRSLALLVSKVTLKSEGKVLAFGEFLRQKPHLRPLVRSMVVSPSHFAPIPLLSLLPRLSHIVLVNHQYDDTRRKRRPTTSLNKSIAWYQKYGMHIRTLHLRNLSFSTFCAFHATISAFTSVRDLTCMDVIIKTEDVSTPLRGSKQRLSERLPLRALTVSIIRHIVSVISDMLSPIVAGLGCGRRCGRSTARSDPADGGELVLDSAAQLQIRGSIRFVTSLFLLRHEKMLTNPLRFVQRNRTPSRRPQTGKDYDL